MQQEERDRKTALLKDQSWTVTSLRGKEPPVLGLAGIIGVAVQKYFIQIFAVPSLTGCYIFLVLTVL